MILGQWPFLQKRRNGSCPIFYFAEFDFYAAFIYECVDQPRKVDVPRGLGMCHNKLFASDTYPCTACGFCVEFGITDFVPIMCGTQVDRN